MCRGVSYGYQQVVCSKRIELHFLGISTGCLLLPTAYIICYEVKEGLLLWVVQRECVGVCMDIGYMGRPIGD